MAHFKSGRVHYTTLEDVSEGAQVMAGTFSVHNHPVTILFDSGASHTFISKECAMRLGLEIESMAIPYNIQSPGGANNYQSSFQTSASTVARKFFYHVSYSYSNPKG